MRPFMKILGALAMMSCGCKGIVLDPLHSDGQDQLIDPGDPGDPGAPEAASAIAMHMSQWSLTPDPGSLFQPAIVVETHPDDLVLFFGSEALACAEPVIQIDPGTDPAECADQAFWQNIVVLPAALAHPGLIDLDDPSIYVYRAAWMPACGGGSGNTPGALGTLEIVSLDATSVAVKLDLEEQSPLPDGNGDYTAAFCP
jgi:hypothetical protein